MSIFNKKRHALHYIPATQFTFFLNFDSTMTTDIYKVGASTLATYIMKLWCRRNWWLIALPPAACLVLAAAVDVKFLLIALMMVFVILPPIMITVYFYHALAPEARMSILPHRTQLSEEGLRLVYEPMAEDIPARDDDMITWSRIKGIKTTQEYIAYRLDSGKYCILLIPRSAFKSPEQYDGWIMMQKRYMTC